MAAEEKPKSEKGEEKKRPPVVTLITAIVGLLTAIAAWKKPPEEPTAKEGYVVLSKAVEQLALDQQKNREDVANLRASFEAYVKAKEGAHNVEPLGMTPPGDPSAATLRVLVTSHETPDGEEITLSPVEPPKPAPKLPDVGEIENRAKQ
jgi:hypothetical protein